MFRRNTETISCKIYVNEEVFGTLAVSNEPPCLYGRMKSKFIRDFGKNFLQSTKNPPTRRRRAFLLLKIVCFGICDCIFYYFVIVHAFEQIFAPPFRIIVIFVIIRGYFLQKFSRLNVSEIFYQITSGTILAENFNSVKSKTVTYWIFWCFGVRGGVFLYANAVHERNRGVDGVPTRQFVRRDWNYS